MRILVTNDDGINSEGLWSLAEALKDVGDVTVVAPDRDQSGVGTAMTLTTVVHAQEMLARPDGIRAFSVEGTPADCVILACEELLEGTIDLIVSGINRGSNVGMDVMVSGTVGAAFQGYFNGISSMAVSAAYTNGAKYDVAAQTARALVRSISDNSVNGPLLLNVNVPSLTLGAIRSVELTTLGPTSYLANVERRIDGARTHYWIKHNRSAGRSVPEGSDMWAVRDNRISITPMEVSFEHGQLMSSFAPFADAVSDGLGLKAAH